MSTTRHLHPAAVFCALFLALFLVGCSGSGTAAFDERDLAQAYLPTTQKVSHPDSLNHVRMAEEDGRLVVKASPSRYGVWERWSSGLEGSDNGWFFESPPYRTFATLRSRELFILQLDDMLGLQTLSADLARARLDEQLAAYDDFVVFEVYVFIGQDRTRALPSTNLGSLGPVISLSDDDGHSYEPAKIDAAFVPDRIRYGRDEGAYYRLNSIAFKRMVDGRDILDGIGRLRLDIRITRPLFARASFTWEIEPPQDTADASMN